MLLSACIREPVSLSKSAKEDYLRAQLYMDNENYTDAVLFLQKFTVKYPYSQYATPAELMRVKAAYYDEQYVLSETLGLRFISAHPEHKDRVYAQYLVAMSYYGQSSSAMLDQKYSYKARDAFIELNQMFPNNPYSKDINYYLNILNNRLAEHELNVAKFYFDKQLYVAAINRLLVVKNEYLNAKTAEESLYYLASAYTILGQKAYADAVVKLMREKFPKGKWHKQALKSK